MRCAVREVAQLFPTAIISGRGREKVESFVQLPQLLYAGSHGMDIAGPKVSDKFSFSRPAAQTHACHVTTSFVSECLFTECYLISARCMRDAWAVPTHVCY